MSGLYSRLGVGCISSLAFPSLLLAAAMTVPACVAMEVDGEDEEPLDELESGSTPPGAIILRWNNIGRSTLLPGDPAMSSRVFAMVHVAMHDAVNAVDDRYKTYLLRRKDSLADPVVAAAQAAHDVMVALRPAQQANLDAQLAVDLAAQPDADKRNRGISLGQEAAALIVANRANDGSSVVIPYTPGTGPGVYQFTPPFNFVILNQWPFVKPFALRSGNMFRALPPPRLDSQQWANAYNEVKDKGSATSTTRTADETEMAIFWQENPALSASKIAEAITIQDNGNLYTAARAFALMFIAMTDGAIVIADTKYTYHFWRPITAIRAGDTDGRADTVPDPSWNSLIVAPPFPEYASGHATLGMSMAVTLWSVYGDDDAFSLTSTVGGATRYYDNVFDAAIEGANSRIVGGIHYRFARDVGLAQGSLVGFNTIIKVLQPD